MKNNESTKKMIVAKARNLLFTARDGEITMNAIAKDLGMTAPTLYHYFKGKDELLESAKNLVVDEVAEVVAISSKFPPSMPAEMRIITLTSLLADYFLKSGVPASYILEDFSPSPLLKEFRSKFEELFDTFFKTKKPDTKISYKQATLRHLALMQADVLYYKSIGAKIPENFAEVIFDKVVE